jgi:hypothetical protein
MWNQHLEDCQYQNTEPMAFKAFKEREERIAAELQEMISQRNADGVANVIMLSSKLCNIYGCGRLVDIKEGGGEHCERHVHPTNHCCRCDSFFYDHDFFHASSYCKRCSKEYFEELEAEELEAEYIDSMSPEEKIVHKLAKKHLKTRDSVSKSDGFLKWLKERHS